jgi:8-oxo-dGTP diphosphatase
VASRDGNGWVRCQLGHRHWGRFGAAGLLAYVTGGRVLLQHRAWWSHHGGTWGLPGGARDSHESALAAALREAEEECGVPPEAVRQTGVFTDDHGGWSYTTVLAQTAAPFAVESDYDESDEVAWVPAGEVGQLPLHPGLSAHWRELHAELSPVTIIVDGANVVGSRPDGWWRDRAGAAVRLRDELAHLVTEGITDLPPGTAGAAESGAAGADRDGADGASLGQPDSAVGGPGTPPAPSGRPSRRGMWLPVGVLDSGDADIARMGDGRILMRWMPDVVLVVEGAARPAASRAGEPGEGSPVSTVAAPGSGDDTIAALAAETAGRRIVVTADRELRQRCIAAGASVAGPGWLLGLI